MSALESNTLDVLLREDRDICDYTLFFVTGEGRFMPNGAEEISGCVRDEAGMVFDFWVGWSDKGQRPVFTEWRPLGPYSEWANRIWAEEALREAS